MKQLVTEAIVLRRIDFGEADRIVTLLTSTQGKLSAIAKGVRKPKSKLAGGIELFSVNTITFIDTPRELKTLVSAQIKHDYNSIIKNGAAATQVAYDILSAVHAYTEVTCEDEYFTISQQALEALNNGVLPQLVGVWFGMRLLAISGHGINTLSDASGRALKSDEKFVFEVSEMTFAVNPAGILHGNHVKLLRLCLVTNLSSLQRVLNVETLSKEVRTLVKTAVNYYSR